MSAPGGEFVEVFLQEASEHLQFLREYSGILQDPYPVTEDIERLHISAHSLSGTSGSYGFPLFAELAGKLAHIFQYALNAPLSPDASAPLVEFISEAVAVLESDLILVSETGAESEDDFATFKAKYPFAFGAVVDAHPEQPLEIEEPAPHGTHGYTAPIHIVHEERPYVAEAQILQPELPHIHDVAHGYAAGAAASASPLEAAIGQNAPLSDEGPVAESDLHESVERNLPMSDHGAEIVPMHAVAARHVEQSTVVELPDLESDGEVPEEILEFFVPEAEEHLQISQQMLLAIEANADPEDIHKLFRSIHTIKGSAAQVGLQRIARVAHRAEDLIGKMRDRELLPSPASIDLCLESLDVLRKFIYRQWPDEQTLQSSVKSLLQRIAKFAPEEDEDAGATLKAKQESAAAIVEDVKPALAIVAPNDESAVSGATVRSESLAEAGEDFVTALSKKDVSALPQSKSVRIALERLDSMMNAVGELVINRTRMLGRLSELEQLTEVLNFSKGRMLDKIGEFQEKHEFSKISFQRSVQPRHSIEFGMPFSASSIAFGTPDDFSDLEMDRYDDFNILSRSLTEISADISEVLTQLDSFVRRVDQDIDEFTKLAHRLQDEITQARMVPIGNLYTRISRSVRDAAKAVGKQVEVTLAGAETELDNNIIQQITDPLLHLVRNAVAHGIESHEERYHAGKTDHGNIAVRAYHRGNHIFIEVEDDGRGLDFENIRKKAVDLKLMSASEAARADERTLLELIFHPGFSTAERKTELAGRGVGLDVVRANLSALNGEIDIDTQTGQGTRFTLKVPLTLIISQALFVRCGSAHFALPLSFVEEIRRIKATDMEEVGGKLLTKVRDVVTEIVRLDQQLGLDPIEPVAGAYRLVIVNTGGRQVGIVVEDVLRKDEIVIKSLGGYLRNVKLFSGATIAPDGSLILLIDVNRLIAGDATERRPLMAGLSAAARVFAPGASAVASGSIPDAALEPIGKEKVVVLADDSISVRKYVGRMLEKAGFRVLLASDGLEALEIATSTPCDMIVTDLEMPRTNGYELLALLRQSPETKGLPVMVVTSRAGAKHRDRAMKEGAAHFMTKPVQEEYFIAAVEDLIGPAKPERISLYAAKA